MRGIILAGGTGSRLHPLTVATSKQLLPVYDKPMVYYPLSLLMLAGIRDIMIITNPEHIESFVRLLGDGSAYGININYSIQKNPNGIAEAFLIAKEFIGDDSVALVLGDNILYGTGVAEILGSASQRQSGATIFGYQVQDPQRYGVVSFDDQNMVTSIEEKPNRPRSNYAVIGLYFYDNSVLSIASELKPSPRGELEITDVNKAYLERGDLAVKLLGRGFAWFDTGTHNSLIDAGNFVRTLSDRQGLRVSAPEEIGWRKGWLSNEDLARSASRFANSGYGEYLLGLLKD